MIVKISFLLFLFFQISSSSTTTTENPSSTKRNTTWSCLFANDICDWSITGDTPGREFLDSTLLITSNLTRTGMVNITTPLFISTLGHVNITLDAFISPNVHLRVGALKPNSEIVWIYSAKGPVMLNRWIEAKMNITNQHITKQFTLILSLEFPSKSSYFRIHDFQLKSNASLYIMRNEENFTNTNSGATNATTVYSSAANGTHYCPFTQNLCGWNITGSGTNWTVSDRTGLMINSKTTYSQTANLTSPAFETDGNVTVSFNAFLSHQTRLLVGVKSTHPSGHTWWLYSSPRNNDELDDWFFIQLKDEFEGIIPYPGERYQLVFLATVPMEDAHVIIRNVTLKSNMPLYVETKTPLQPDTVSNTTDYPKFNTTYYPEFNTTDYPEFNRTTVLPGTDNATFPHRLTNNSNVPGQIQTYIHSQTNYILNFNISVNLPAGK